MYKQNHATGNISIMTTSINIFVDQNIQLIFAVIGTRVQRKTPED